MISINLKKRIVTSLVLLISLFLIFSFNIVMIYSLIILGVLSIIEFLQLTNKIFSKKFGKYFINIFFIIYVFVFCIFFTILSNNIGSKISLYVFLLGCISSDIGGFIFGKIFKGPKLTKISPNKTYSGALGSIILTLIVLSFLFYEITKFFNMSIIITAITVSISCQLGDLMFSYLKRKAKSKDTGNILPGHGGVLDRLDGIFFGVPIGFLTLMFLN